MATLFAGDGGTALFCAVDRDALVACEGLAEPAVLPDGRRAVPIGELPTEGVDGVLLAAGEGSTREHVRSWAAERGIACDDAPLEPLSSPDDVRVIAVAAGSTGSGKTWLTRRVARGLRRSGVAVAVARHPITALLGWDGRWEAVVADPQEGLGVPGPLCEIEELAPLLDAGVRVATGLDHRGVFDAAVDAAGGDRPVVVWDGGGSAPPWVEADYTFVAVDALRPDTMLAERVRTADAVVITKTDTAPAERTKEAEERVRAQNPDAALVLADLPPQVREGPELVGRRVVCVEDAPSLMLGGLKAGAASVAARRFRCGVVDPRPFAVGAVARTLEEHPQVGPVVPTLGRTPAELDDLARTIRAMPGEAILWGSPAPPQVVIPDEQRPVMRVLPELMEVAGPPLQTLLADFLPGAG